MDRGRGARRLAAAKKAIIDLERLKCHSPHIWQHTACEEAIFVISEAYDIEPEDRDQEPAKALPLGCGQRHPDG